MNLELLHHLIEIPSEFLHEERIADFIDKWVRKNVDCRSKSQKVSSKRINLLYSKGTGKKAVLLAGHLDTISMVTGWKIDPLKSVEKNGKLYGLGAWDMKSGLLILLECLKEFDPKNITLKVAFTVDEENYSEGAFKLVNSDFCKDVEFVLVPEPGFIHGDKGITIGRAGRSTYVVKIVGQSVHGSHPETGINAILQANAFIQEALKLKLASDPHMGKTILFPRAIQSQAKGFSIPDECEVELDCRLIIPNKPEAVLESLQELAQRMFQERKLFSVPVIRYKDRPTDFCAPYKLDRKNKYVQFCKKAVEEITGDAILYYRDSVADECIYTEKLKVPAVCIGTTGGNAHEANEFVEIDSISRVKQVILKILNDIDEGEEI